MKPARRVALGGILGGLSLLFLYLSAVIPSGRWGMVAVAGLAVAAAVVAGGLSNGLGVYIVVVILGAIFVPDKLNWLLYLAFFGLYPMVKSLLERGKDRWLTLLLKLIFFNAILTGFLLIFPQLFLPALPEQIQGKQPLIYLGGSVLFLVYDFGFTKLMTFCQQRIGKTIS